MTADRRNARAFSAGQHAYDNELPPEDDYEDDDPDIWCDECEMTMPRDGAVRLDDPADEDWDGDEHWCCWACWRDAQAEDGPKKGEYR